jgi:hypothetical protein
MLLIPFRQQLKRLERHVAVWMANLGDAKRDVGVNEDHQPSRSKCFPGYHRSDDLEVYGCQPKR